jgi:hypothetical protein
MHQVLEPVLVIRLVLTVAAVVHYNINMMYTLSSLMTIKPRQWLGG